MDAALWLVAGVLLLVVEMLTLAVVAGMAGAGALVAALTAALGAPLVVQAGAFVVTSTGLLVFAREPAQRALRRGRDDSPSADPRALTGAAAVVVERVSESSGQVRLHGELWRARPYAGTAPVEAGQTVSVAAVEGATLLVYSPDLL
jgi:membrane protein implicated in regulation of membrane protease activity